MKIWNKTWLSIFLVLVISFFTGYWMGIYKAKLKFEEDLHALELSRSLLDVTQLTSILTGFREGKTSLMIDRLETELDFALVSVGREYSPKRDIYHSAERDVKLARDYRLLFPYTSSLGKINNEVKSVLDRDFQKASSSSNQ